MKFYPKQKVQVKKKTNITATNDGEEVGKKAAQFRLEGVNTDEATAEINVELL